MASLRTMAAIFCACAAAPLVAGEPEAKGGAAPRPPRMQDLVAAIPAAALDDDVVLQAGDVKIPLTAVAKAESAYVVAMKRQQPDFVLNPQHQAMLRRMTAFRLLLNASVEKYVADNKIEADKAKFEAEFDKLKQAQKDKGQTYEQFLVDNGLEDAEFRRFWQANWAVEQKLAQGVSDADVNKVLAEQTESLPLRRASHILFMYKGAERAPATVTRTKEEAKAAADEVLKKIQAGGDFAALAKAQSDCPSKESGGDLNFFGRKGGMVESFAAATYALGKAGDVTATPVETPFGYHVIKLTEMKNTDEMKSQIRGQLAGQKLGQQMQQIAESAVAGAKFNGKLLAPVTPATPATPEKPKQ